MQKLIDFCKEALYKKHIGKRTIAEDIRAMRNDEYLGYFAPIKYDRYKNGYYYEYPDYSIDNIPINNEELQAAYRKPKYKDGKEKLLSIHEELKVLNRSAANSLKEGLEETLTIHRLGVTKYFDRSFTTTNCIENLNSQ